MGAKLSKKSMDQPDERRTPDKTTMDVVTLGDMNYARIRFEPGWRWSTCIKPVAGTDSCQTRHVGYVISGHVHVVHDDGSEVDMESGDAVLIEPGHDAWVVGDEPYVGIEISPAPINYAKGG
jgi:mannose-6-phosphate isomerase-like protein (cupin superfamily)